MSRRSADRRLLRKALPLRPLLLGSALLFLVAPGTAAAQSPWSFLLAPQLSRSLDEENGPALGALGASLQFVRAPSDGGWGWGGSAALHRLGTFEPAPAPDRTLRAVALGVRGYRGSPADGWFVSLGADLLIGQESRPGSDSSSDPGVGGYAGVGRTWRPGAGSAGVFWEVGLTGAALTGENTAAGGVYLSFRLGLVVD